MGCILSKFYIKPQLNHCVPIEVKVVSYRNSTSNHNTEACFIKRAEVVSYRNSTSNHNCCRRKHWDHSCILSKFYIKPQQAGGKSLKERGCILSKFYIKPQPTECTESIVVVVSYRNSTSNHNMAPVWPDRWCVVSYRNSTSNHNLTMNREYAM